MLLYNPCVVGADNLPGYRFIYLIRLTSPISNQIRRRGGGAYPGLMGYRGVAGILLSLIVALLYLTYELDTGEGNTVYKKAQ